MTITDLVAPEAILPALKVNSKKQALQELAARAAALTGQNERAIFEVLLQREKLGTTAVGYGVAIPHGKLPKLEKLFGLFARLERPIDFEAMDGQPVDLVFLLLAPEGAGADHLKALARIARLLRDQDVAKKLRASRDAPGDLFGAGAAAGERGVRSSDADALSVLIFRLPALAFPLSVKHCFFWNTDIRLAEMTPAKSCVKNDTANASS